jgi:hypothetical protein
VAQRKAESAPAHSYARHPPPRAPRARADTLRTHGMRTRSRGLAAAVGPAAGATAPLCPYGADRRWEIQAAHEEQLSPAAAAQSYTRPGGFVHCVTSGCRGCSDDHCGMGWLRLPWVGTGRVMVCQCGCGCHGRARGACRCGCGCHGRAWGVCGCSCCCRVNTSCIQCGSQY